MNVIQVFSLSVFWENSHNCRGKECGPFPIVCFVFIYVCVCFPVWGHLSSNSWKQAVYSRALSQNTLTPDRGVVAGRGNHPSSDFAQLYVLNHWRENFCIKCIFFFRSESLSIPHPSMFSQVTGQCPCKLGYSGKRCSECQENYYSDPLGRCIRKYCYF